MMLSFSWNTKYLTSEHLQGFQKYKYSSVDTNPIGKYVMHPFWNWLIKFFPRWLAPNLITFIGFLFIVKSFLLLSYFDYYFYASSNKNADWSSIPNWVFAVVAFNIFISYTLDGIDGKQARRTQTSGPLGELFDHGLDSWTTVFIPIFLYSTFGRNSFSLPPKRLYFICWNVFFNFYISHVEKYNTGILYLPWSYDLSMLGTVFIFGFTSVLSHNVWKKIIFRKYSIANLLEFFFYLSTCIFNIPIVIYNLYTAYSTKKGRNLGLAEGLRPLIPLIYFLLLSLIWLHYSPTNIVERDPRAFCLLAGNIFSNICCKLIIAQMSNTRCQIFNWMLIPFSIIILVSIIVPSLELFLLYVILMISVIYHIHYGTCVVKQMCDHFDIMCFRIHSKY
ncbi:hypothetical protein PGB90_006541 [Kerria lacca]